MNHDQLKAHIEAGFIAPNADTEKFVDHAFDLLDQGQIRVCENKNGEWIVNEWVKKAILLFFRLKKMSVIENGPFTFVDKVPLKQWTGGEGVRVVPQALVRRGAFIEAGAVLMPSYVNIGAHVGKGTMVDTWATVGSCAYVGANVHLSGGVGIGGVLEPLQAKPVIIEDNVFVGSRSILVEGVHVAQGAVIGAGVTITGSTKILDVTQSPATEYKGFVPENSVVIPGTLPKTFAAGTYGVPCALIIGQRKPSTDLKTSLNDALRNFEVSV
ncbi:MAG: 2,3,4,5-tetrahydropyridine-2,6-dicarboxylate N-succinyltransferase [Bdellovibrionales bacterium]|nr:2,3,4,5-tetrahydropyridine-2,6-dicarboxylate N-succinyltransferase [Bdellovibrionales bacterium]